jgi:hypothetical protein
MIGTQYIANGTILSMTIHHKMQHWFILCTREELNRTVQSSLEDSRASTLVDGASLFARMFLRSWSFYHACVSSFLHGLCSLTLRTPPLHSPKSHRLVVDRSSLSLRPHSPRLSPCTWLLSSINRPPPHTRATRHDGLLRPCQTPGTAQSLPTLPYSGTPSDTA